MRGDIFTLQDFEQFHLHGVAHRIADGSLGRYGQNDWIVDLRGTLFERTDDVLTDVAG